MWHREQYRATFIPHEIVRPRAVFQYTKSRRCLWINDRSNYYDWLELAIFFFIHKKRQPSEAKFHCTSSNVTAACQKWFGTQKSDMSSVILPLNKARHKGIPFRNRFSSKTSQNNSQKVHCRKQKHVDAVNASRKQMRIIVNYVLRASAAATTGKKSRCYFPRACISNFGICHVHRSSWPDTRCPIHRAHFVQFWRSDVVSSNWLTEVQLDGWS